jgi:hypothetical protein
LPPDDVKFFVGVVNLPIATLMLHVGYVKFPNGVMKLPTTTPNLFADVVKLSTYIPKFACSGNRLTLQQSSLPVM